MAGVCGGGACIVGGHAWQGGICDKGGMCGKGDMHGRRDATAADSMHPTGMHSCIKWSEDLYLVARG